MAENSIDVKVPVTPEAAPAAALALKQEGYPSNATPPAIALASKEEGHPSNATAPALPAPETRSFGQKVFDFLVGSKPESMFEEFPKDANGNVLCPDSFAALSSEDLQKADAVLMRRLDTRILPILFFLFFFNYLDRTNIAAAAVANKETGHSMLQTLGLSLDQYNLIVSIFFIGYILFEIPSNILMKMASPSKWIARICISWGIVAACMAACSNFGGLLACRFLLGVMEAGLSPGIVYYLTFWYKRSERGFRVAAFYLAGSLSIAIGGLISAGIIQLNLKGGLYGWQWLLILEGIPSVIIGVVTWFMLPDYPHTTKFLTPDERQYLEFRLAGGAGSDPRGKAWVQEEAIAFAKNPLSYLFAFGSLVPGILVNGMSAYGPQIIISLGFTSTGAIAMSAPIGVCCMIAVIVSSLTSDKFGDRYFHLLIILAGPFIAYITFATAAADAYGVKLFMFFLGSMGLACVTPISMAWRTDTTYGTTYTALATSTLLTIANVGGVIAPYLFKPSDAPLYRQAFTALAALSIVGMLVYSAIYFVEYKYPKYGGPSGTLHFSKNRRKSMVDMGQFGGIGLQDEVADVI